MGVKIPTRLFCAATVLAMMLIASPRLNAQTTEYTRRNTFTFLGQYSPDSGHILAGYAEDRRLFALGFEYERKIYSSNKVAWTWLMQVRPLMQWSDLAVRGYRDSSGNTVSIDPVRVAGRGEVGVRPTADSTPIFGRTNTYAFGANPMGMKLNFGVRNRLQPVATGMFGFIVGSRDLPVDKSSAFNFVAEFGGGLEYFATPEQSVRLDYKFHHYSNAQLGTRNPGVDSGVLQLSYSFGK